MTDPATDPATHTPLPAPPRPVRSAVFVTGPSGAGRTTAIRALEDLGFEAIDNLPLPLVPRLLGAEAPDRPLAIGIDARTRGFSPAALIDSAHHARDTHGYAVDLLFLDCSDATLLRRFSETRRRHPLSPSGSVETGIAREREMLLPLRRLADMLIDTSDLTPHELKARMGRLFAEGAAPGLAITIESFSFKRGTPQGLDIVFDVRFLSNPHWVPELRPQDGRAPAVADHVSSDPRYDPFLDRFIHLILELLPAYRDEGRAYLTIGLGCTGGQHRSVAVTEAVAKRLELSRWPVSIRHRELERLGRAETGSPDPALKGKDR